MWRVEWLTGDHYGERPVLKHIESFFKLCIYMHMETKTEKIKHRLEQDGWYLTRHGSDHDIYRHPGIKGIITLPRHKTVSPGVARSIARKAGWLE